MAIDGSSLKVPRTKTYKIPLRSESADPEAIAKAKAFDELGSTGLQRTGQRGLVIEEFLPELIGERARRVFREMRDNDPVIGAILYAIEMIVRNVTWNVEGPDEEMVEFVDSCLGDMSNPWEDLLAEILSMITYGFSWHEVIYKRRLGAQKDPSKRSKFNDGKIGWRKMPIRAQDSLSDWIWDDEGGIQTFVQIAPPDYVSVEIPIDRSLLFRVGLHKGNPEGRSLLRNAYRSWYFKKKIETIEAIGIERDLAGMPVIYRSGDVAAKYDDEFKKILQNIRRDEQDGLLMPMVYDEGGHQMCTFDLVSSAGNRQIDVGAVVDRYNKVIASTVLADFILLGQGNVGSFALSSNKTELFATALGAILKSIASVFNRYAIPRLLAVNGFKYEDPPILVPGDLETPDLEKLGAYISALSGSGAPLFPDDELENYLRTVAHLPAKPEGEGAQVPQAITPPPKEEPKEEEKPTPAPKKEKPAKKKPTAAEEDVTGEPIEEK